MSEAPQDQVLNFNAKVEQGAAVDYIIDGRIVIAKTRAPAQVLHDGRAVVWIKGRLGAVDLNLVEVCSKVDVPVRENRTHYIKVRLTPKERVQAEQKAALLNLSMSDMIRGLVLGEQWKPDSSSDQPASTQQPLS